jgi:hypothetical protein
VTITTPGNYLLSKSNTPDFFGKYEKDKVMVAAEFQRLSGSLLFQGLSPTQKYDLRSWYAMGSYKLTGKLTGGVYVSQDFDLATALGPSRFSKDWTVSGRYDFGQYVYAKAEEHFIDGTSVGYDTNLNQHGLEPDTKLTILKIGVSF